MTANIFCGRPLQDFAHGDGRFQLLVDHQDLSRYDMGSYYLGGEFFLGMSCEMIGTFEVCTRLYIPLRSYGVLGGVNRLSNMPSPLSAKFLILEAHLKTRIVDHVVPIHLIPP